MAFIADITSITPPCEKMPDSGALRDVGLNLIFVRIKFRYFSHIMLIYATHGAE